MFNKWWLIIVVGLIIRLIIASSTFHPDIRTFQYAGEVVAGGNILNVYDYQTSLPQNNPMTTMVVFNYPPAIYLLHGSSNFILSKVLGLTLVNQFLIEKVGDFGNFQFNLHLLLVKIPYFIFDFLTAFFLMKLFDNKKEKFLALTLWMFNPLSLYASFMMGQFDIIPVFFTVLSLVLARKNKLSLGAISLGFGAAFKIYPLFLLIPFALQGKTWFERGKLLFLGILPYLFFILPYMGSKGFRSTALVANQSLKSLYAELAISGGEKILIFPFLLLLFYIVFIYFKEPIKLLWKRYFLVLLLFFIFTHYHPQWFLWITPFLIIDIIKSQFKSLPLLLLVLFSFFGLLFFFDSSLTITIFAPLVPSLYGLPSVWDLLHIPVDYNLARSLLQTIFVAPAVYYVYLYFPRGMKEKVKEI